MKRIFDFIKNNINTWLTIFLICVILYQITRIDSKVNDFKDFKDGVQNHLLWSIKGECFFVKPQTEKTVYLVRVEDCDRK
jgi:hypothetical protein